MSGNGGGAAGDTEVIDEVCLVGESTASMSSSRITCSSSARDARQEVRTDFHSELRHRLDAVGWQVDDLRHVLDDDAHRRLPAGRRPSG